MSNPIQVGPLTDANPRKLDPIPHQHQLPPQGSPGTQSASASGPHTVGISPGIKLSDTLPDKPTNPYAPTGWRRKQAVEFDVQLPSGQVARIRRLERNDLFKLKIIDHLDKLLPLLIDNSSSDEQQTKVKEAISRNAHMIDDLFNVMDIVVFACCVNPMVTADPNAVIIDETIPVNVVHIDDIDVDDRMIIFNAAFGLEADALKSVLGQASGVGSVPAVEDVQLPAQHNS